MTCNIYYSPRKGLPVALACIVLACGCGWLVGADEPVGVIVGWIGVLFFGGLGALLLFLFLFRTRHPAVVISDHGLQLNNPLRPSRSLFLPWHAIEGFRSGDFADQRFILIDVKDLPRRIGEAGPLRRMMMRVDVRLARTPYSIASDDLDRTEEELLALLGSVLDKYRATHGSA